MIKWLNDTTWLIQCAVACRIELSSQINYIDIQGVRDSIQMYNFQTHSAFQCWDIALRWMPNIANDESTLVQVVDSCLQATNCYLSQCWHRSMSPHGVIRTQWVNRNSLYKTHIFKTVYITHIFKISYIMHILRVEHKFGAQLTAIWLSLLNLCMVPK